MGPVVSDEGVGTGTTPSDHTGLLIIRAWTEQGSSDPLRAQVRLSSDVSVGIERTLTLVRADDVCAAVREWLAVMSRGAERPD